MTRASRFGAAFGWPRFVCLRAQRRPVEGEGLVSCCDNLMRTRGWARALHSFDGNERLGHMRRASLTDMNDWGTCVVRAWRTWTIGAHFARRAGEECRLWRVGCATNVGFRRIWPELMRCGPSHVPQTQIPASYLRRTCHKRKSLAAIPVVRATNASFHR